jgi:hypothetical protein
MFGECCFLQPGTAVAINLQPFCHTREDGYPSANLHASDAQINTIEAITQAV